MVFILELMLLKTGQRRSFLNGRNHTLKMEKPGVLLPLKEIFISQKITKLFGLMSN